MDEETRANEGENVDLPVAVHFLSSTQAMGSYSENYGNPRSYLNGRERDEPVTVIGQFSVCATRYNRLAGPREVSQPGLKLIAFNGGEYKVPEITADQFTQALKTAKAGENGLIYIDLAAIQKKNYENEDFPAEEVGRPFRSFC